MIKQEAEKRENPIDKDKIAENPHILPYAHSVGSAIIKPIDKGRVKGMAMSAMYEQTDVQLTQLREQVELLIEQARQIHERVDISEKIYLADMGFAPRVGHTYHLYERSNGKPVLSLVSPDEWGANPPYAFQASVRLLSDHTWEVVDADSDTYKP
ncbi:MAG: DUF2452 domain-containing protein [Bacteroidota bacterium]